MSLERNYWSRYARKRVSRRSVLRGATAAGAGLAGAALIGCGGDDDEPEATATTAPSGDGTASPTGTAAGTSTPAASGGIKRGGIWEATFTNDPPTIDPYGNLSFLTKGTAAYAYSRLYKVATQPDTNPWAVGVEPDLAESAESEDGQHWTVRLKQGVKFHNKAPVNGREVTAEDVVFSHDVLLGPESPGADNARNSGWDSAEVVDDYTIQFITSSPSAAFLETLADTNLLFVVPTEYDGGFDPRTEMIGSGPWVLESYRPSQDFTWTANRDYYVEGQPYLDGVHNSLVPEYAQSIAQLEANNIMTNGINANDVIDLRGRHQDWQWLGLQSALLSFMYFSPAEVEPDAAWQDVRFRQAVSMAQDRAGTMDAGYNVTALLDAGLDVATTWNNIIPAGFGERWWLDPQGPNMGDGGANFQFNQDEARKLLAAGGWEGLAFPYRWSANVYGSTFNAIAEIVGNFLLEVGLAPETMTEDYASRYITNTFRGDFTGVAFGYETPFPEVGGYPTRQFGDDPANHSRWSGPEVDRLREIAQQQALEFDEEARRELFHEYQRINAEHMFYIPQQAGAGTGWTAYQPYVRGLRQTRGYGAPVETILHFWLDL